MTPPEFMQRLAALEFMQRLAALEFMQRLAALVPRPRLHLMRFHGVLAPNAKLRCRIAAMIFMSPSQFGQCSIGKTFSESPRATSNQTFLKRPLPSTC